VFDLLIPPLTVLICLLIVDLFCAIIAWLALSQSAPVLISLVNLLALSAALVLAWDKFGRDILTSDRFFLVFKYALSKMGLYIRMYSRKRSPSWIRTERDSRKK
jgi:hypothetical protein